jgi:membrane protein DedA with SNARE-associated domain/rhodanese-related sulfurtransferase
MQETIDFLIRHGYWVLFGITMAEQMALPIPAIPALLAMGALAGTGRFSFGTAMLFAIAGATLADNIMYTLGRRKGHSLLRLLCRLSLEPDSCVSATRFWFRKLGSWAVVVAKLFPGLTTIAAPMAGLSKMPWWRFALADLTGSVVWSVTYMSLGYIFRAQLEEVAAAVVRLGSWLAAVIFGLMGLWIAYKLWQRRRFLRSLHVARIRPEELKDRLLDVVLVDLRSPSEVDWDGLKIPGALWFDRSDLESRQAEIPRDRDVVLYCTCPNEVTSAGAAMRLMKLGITRVRPLEGGYDAWREMGYPLVPAEVAVHAE